MQYPNAAADAINALRSENEAMRSLIADLAKVVAGLQGSTCEGVFYTYASWREKVEDIAKRAESRS